VLEVLGEVCEPLLEVWEEGEVPWAALEASLAAPCAVFEAVLAAP
jgi:hypothetical protein